MRHGVQRQALEDAGKSERVVAVEMRDADLRDLRGRHARQQHLALRPLTGVELESVTVVLEQVAVVVAVPRRRLRAFRASFTSVAVGWRAVTSTGLN